MNAEEIPKLEIEHAIAFYDEQANMGGPDYLAQVDKLARATKDPGHGALHTDYPDAERKVARAYNPDDDHLSLKQSIQADLCPVLAPGLGSRRFYANRLGDLPTTHADAGPGSPRRSPQLTRYG